MQGTTGTLKKWPWRAVRVDRWYEGVCSIDPFHPLYERPRYREARSVLASGETTDTIDQIKRWTTKNVGLDLSGFGDYPKPPAFVLEVKGVVLPHLWWQLINLSVYEHLEQSRA